MKREGVSLFFFYLLAFLYLFTNHAQAKENAPPSEAFLEKLKKALDKTDSLIKKISDEWDIPNYPKFLKSCFMHKSAWETMKWKYMTKILEKEMHEDHKVAFTISFSGSSVTAGHDSHFNHSTPIVAGEYMREAFTALDLQLYTHNFALGNNPCMPYDLCIKFFAGFDADVVIWEQNYFCEGSPLMEQFIRQAMTIPTRPIVAFSESNTGHWDQKSCQKGPHRLTSQENDLIKTNPLTIASEMNKDEFHKTWGTINNVMKHYHGAALQTFQHATFTEYACLGPYIKTWMDGAASWHPSVIGHRVRAAHHAYFWLQIYREAVQEILWSKRALSALHKDVQHHLDHNYKPMSEKAASATPFVDNVTCYTDYEPRAVREASLKDMVISGLAADKSSPGWKFIIYENLVDKSLVERSLAKGYHDYKYLIYTDDESKDLSVKVPVPKPGPIFICQTPGIWGSLPPGFDKLWEAPIDIYITYGVESYEKFEFKEENAVKQEIVHEKQLLDICLQLKSSKHDLVHPVGNHVLTIHLKEKRKLIFAWLITP